MNLNVYTVQTVNSCKFHEPTAFVTVGVDELAGLFLCCSHIPEDRFSILQAHILSILL